MQKVANYYWDNMTTDHSKVIMDMQAMMDKLLEQIEENFHNDPAFRMVRRYAAEMKDELEEALESYEDR